MKEDGIKNYLAELTTLSLPSLNILEEEWIKCEHANQGFSWDGRCYLPEIKYTNFFKNIINNIKDQIGFQHKNVCLQIRQIGHPKCALTSHIIHKDSNRNSLCVFPVSTITDPVCFYTDEMILKNKEKTYKNHPDLISFYSHNHPILMNTQKYHNVFIIDKNKPRILIQLEYEETFEQILEKNLSLFKLLK